MPVFLKLLWKSKTIRYIFYSLLGLVGFTLIYTFIVLWTQVCNFPLGGKWIAEHITKMECPKDVVLKFDPVTEEETIDFGKDIDQLRGEANQCVVDDNLLKWYQEATFQCVGVTFPGDAYREFPVTDKALIHSGDSGDGSSDNSNKDSTDKQTTPVADPSAYIQSIKLPSSTSNTATSSAISINQSTLQKGAALLSPTSEPTTPTTPTESKTVGDKIVEDAYTWLNKYGHNTATPLKYTNQRSDPTLLRLMQADCSYFVMRIVEDMTGVNIGSNTGEQLQQHKGTLILDKNQVKPGDLVYSYVPGDTGYGVNIPGVPNLPVGHVGIYVGNNQVINESTFGEDLKLSTAFPKSFTFLAALRMGDAGTGADYSGAGVDPNAPTISEGELHVRALRQIDEWALAGQQWSDKKLTSDKYKDTKVGIVWAMTKKIQSDAEANKSTDFEQVWNRAHRTAEDKKAGAKDWTNEEWMEYTQFEVYKCYMLGDEKWNNGFFSFFKNVFGVAEKPCEYINNVYREVLKDRGKPTEEKDKNGNDVAVDYIPPQDQGKVTQQYKIERVSYFCVADPPTPTPTPTPTPIITGPTPLPESTDSTTGTTSPINSGDLSKLPVSLSIATSSSVKLPSNTEKATAQWDLPPTTTAPEPTYNNNQKIEEDKPTCGEGSHLESQTQTEYYVTHTNVLQILFDFEKYSLWEDGVTAYEKHDGSFKDTMILILSELYKDYTGMDQLPQDQGFPEWLVPMEEGSYYMTAPYGCRNVTNPSDKVPKDCSDQSLNDLHYGVTLDAEGNAGVPVFATQGGIVIFANPDKDSPVGVAGDTENKDIAGYGGVVIVKHDNGWVTTYANIKRSDIMVRKGWKIVQGQVLGAANTDSSNPSTYDMEFKMCKSDTAMFDCEIDKSNDKQEYQDPEKDPINMVFNKDGGNNGKIKEATDFFKKAKDTLDREVPQNQEQTAQSLIMPGFSGGGGSDFDWGQLSEEYETHFRGLGVCVVIPGDKGGLSCGPFQMSQSGALPGFADYMCKNGPAFQLPSDACNLLSSASLTRDENGPYAQAFKQIADQYPQPFREVQDKLASDNYLKPILKFIQENNGYNANAGSRAIRSVLFSSAINHGVGGAKGVIKDAFGSKNISSMNPNEMIDDIYDQRLNRTGGFQYNIDRFKTNERCDAHAMYRIPTLDMGKLPVNSYRALTGCTYTGNS